MTDSDIAPGADESGDGTLGMESSITRRDFLGATLLASGAQLLHPFFARPTSRPTT